MQNKIYLFLILLITLYSKPMSHPFPYDLAIKIYPRTAAQQPDEVTICCHGYGQSSRFASIVKQWANGIFKEPIVGFNFPDFGITQTTDHADCAYGTINELLPLLFLIKQYACNNQNSTVHLYGFSAGGGAIINALAILNSQKYEPELLAIGITTEDKKIMRTALERGQIFLDCPLKSISEIIAHRGESNELAILAEKYNTNAMNPIDTLLSLKGLSLNIFIHFQDPDEILSNRDDALFIERLKEANNGITKSIISTDRGHIGYHATFWHFIKQSYDC